MAVFRIEKTRDYTVMSNHHLKDRTLTLKSKGLLSMMLSLPDEWNYTTRGLAAICREGVDCIGAALKELETHGYIRRTQLRDEKGKITDTVCSARKVIRIAGDDYPAEVVKSRFMKLDSSHVQYVMDCMKDNTTYVRNIKKYLLAALYNAPTTINSYYSSLVQHDMYGNGQRG